MTDLCTFLDWDTEFFGRRIGRVNVNRLDEATAAAIDAWATDHAVECLYFLADNDSIETVRAAEKHGYSLMDIRVTLEAGVDGARWRGDTIGVRDYRPDDLERLKAIARYSHTDSRFYADPHFPRERCDTLYATWVERSCNRESDHIGVIAHDGEAIGYMISHVDAEGRGSLDLLGVDMTYRGHGLGRALVLDALQWFVTQGLENSVIITQGRNIVSQRLFQSYGFRTSVVQLWYHRWYTHSQP